MAEKSMEEEIDATETFADTLPAEQDVEPAQPKEEPPKEPNPEDGRPGDEPEGKDEPAKPVEAKEETPPPDPKDEGRQDYGKDGHTPKGVQQRFSEFSRQVRGLRDENAQLKAEIEKLKSQQPKEQPKGRDQFATDEEWIDHVAGIKAQQIVEKRLAEERERSEIESARKEYMKSEDEARLKVDDFDDVMGVQMDLPVDRDTFLYVMKSPQGAMIQYTLRKIEAVRNQLLAAPAEGKLAVIKGIEKRLQEIEKQPQAPKQPAQPPQEAPRPPEIREPSQARTVPARSLDPATCSMDEWMENGD